MSHWRRRWHSLTALPLVAFYLASSAVAADLDAGGPRAIAPHTEPGLAPSAELPPLSHARHRDRLVTAADFASRANSAPGVRVGRAAAEPQHDRSERRAARRLDRECRIAKFCAALLVQPVR